MPKQVFYAGLETSRAGLEAGRRSDDSGDKEKKKSNGNGDAGKKQTRPPIAGRRKTRSDTQH